MDRGFACLAYDCDSVWNTTVTSGNTTHLPLRPPGYTPVVAAIAVMIAVCATGVVVLLYLAIERIVTSLVRNVFYGMGRPRKASDTIGEEFEECEEDQNVYTDAYDDPSARRETIFVGPAASQV